MLSSNIKNSSRKSEWIDTADTSERQILDLRRIRMRHALALGRFHYGSAAPPLPEQCHKHWLVLQFVLSGEQRIVIDGRERRIRGGEMMRLLPGQRYGSGVWHEQRGEMAWLILKCKPLPRGAALGMSADGIREIFGMLLDPFAPTVVAQAPEVLALLDSVFDEWSRRDEAIARETIRNRISALMLSAAASLVSNEIDPPVRANELRIRQVVSWMEENPEDQSSGNLLAERAGLSLARFHFHFKRLTGSSPLDYRQRLRIEQAAQRLRESASLSITEVAYELGFSSSQYFATVFRRYLGVSPSYYRQSRNDFVEK